MSRKHWKVAVLAAALAAAPALAQAKSGKLDEKLTEATQKLHAANQGEVQLGQLGAQQAQSPEVKSFADRMVTDHQQNDQQLTQLAPTLGVSLQGGAFTKAQRDAQKDLKDVQGKSGADFDKAYMKLMVKDHEKDVKEIGNAAKAAHKANQAELASFLDQTHSTLQSHLDEAKRVEKSLGKSGGVAGTSGSTGASGSATSPSSTGNDTGATSPSRSESSGTAASPERSSTAAPPSRESRGDTGGSIPTTEKSPGTSGSTGSESSDTAGTSGSTGHGGTTGSTGSSGTQSR